MIDAPDPEARFGRAAAIPAENGAAAAPSGDRRPLTADPVLAASQPAPQKPAAAPASLRRSRQSRGQTVVFLNFLLSCLVIAMIMAGGVLWYGKTSFDAPGPSDRDTTFSVKPRTGVGEIADQLERKGLISDARVFQVGIRVAGNGTALKAGEFAIPAHASMRDIMGVIASGKTVMYSLTIPEGLTVEQAFERIAAQEELDGDMPADTPPEGSLAADTQRFPRGTPRRQIVEKMMAEQKALVDEIWAERATDLPLADVNEFVTLASIVEKETGIDTERPRVAAVFVNRLAKGMRLQSDPTIIYGLFGGKGKPADRPIYKSDVDKPTPYNTYLIKGLPPTPIANPGRAALEAVADPAPTGDLYFVADGSGGHVFASTLAAHNRNVARWREIERQRAEAAGGPAEAEAR